MTAATARMPTSRATASITVPFTVAIDTREQLAYAFDGLRADADQRRRPLIVPAARVCLSSGDYSIVGHEPENAACQPAVAVERKSLADLFSTIGQGRSRFERELERLNAVCDVAAVVVEAEWSQVLLSPPPHSQLPPKIVFRSVIAWQQRWPRVHWWWLPDRWKGEQTTFRILERWWKERQR